MVKRVAFIHPDLGIGGAEQLVVNLCLGVIDHGYSAHIFTPYHHQSFPETHNGTISVQEHGSFFGLIPPTIFGYFKGILAYIRTVLAALWLIFYGGKYQVVVADQVSFVLPFLRMTGHKTIFYCHFPDKLLAGKRNNPLKIIYRFFIDSLEEFSLLFAHKIYVNSQYTKQIFYKSFPIINKIKKIDVEVLYPSIDFSQFDKDDHVDTQIEGDYFFSLNRYERKKNIGLAIEAFSDLIKKNPEGTKKLKLVIAGGYDLKVQENVQHHQQLQELAKKEQVESKTIFLRSISNERRKSLLKGALAVLYTPENEHFGIVPCEAMYCNVPVLADNSGGPVESIGNSKCGYLIDGGREEWMKKMKEVLERGKKPTQGKERMKEKFGFQMFSKQFVQGINSLCNPS